MPAADGTQSGSTLSKTDANFWLDCWLLVLVTVLCWAATVVRFVFPPPSRAAGWTLWGWDYDAWASLQFGVVAALAASVLVHVMLHWSWVCGVVSGKVRKRTGAATPPVRGDASRTLWGVGLLIVVLNLIGLGVAAAALTVKAPL